MIDLFSITNTITIASASVWPQGCIPTTTPQSPPESDEPCPPVGVWPAGCQEELTVDFPLFFYEPFVLKYNPNKWWVTLDEYGRNMLTHTSISNCEIKEQGPAGGPPSLEPVQIGEITYLMYETIILDTNIVYRAYLANETIPGWTDSSTVVLTTRNTVGDVNCESDQRDVLAKLGAP